MTMPLDLVLVRHGESEGNVANEASRRGNDNFLTEEFRTRHPSTWHLTDKGCKQALATGEWLRANFAGAPYFDRYYVSDYARTLETAALLGLPDAQWKVEFYLRERERGYLEVMPHSERIKQPFEDLKWRDEYPFYWRPGNGESLADLCMRIDRVNDTLHRECSDKRVVIVCHGEVMWAERVRLERMLPHDFATNHANFRIENCQIIHYTRRNPETGAISPYLQWVRMICPWELSKCDTRWKPIVRQIFSNEELLEIGGSMPGPAIAAKTFAR